MKRIVSIAFALLFVASVALSDNITKLSQNYPNPANGITYVNVEFSSPDATLIISNILGESLKVLKLSSSGTFSIDVTDMPEGVYFYTLDADGHKATKRLTVKK